MKFLILSSICNYSSNKSNKNPDNVLKGEIRLLQKKQQKELNIYNSSSAYNAANWDAAYSWGNHADYSYLTLSSLPSSIVTNGAKAKETLLELVSVPESEMTKTLSKHGFHNMKSPSQINMCLDRFIRDFLDHETDIEEVFRVIENIKPKLKSMGKSDSQIINLLKGSRFIDRMTTSNDRCSGLVADIITMATIKKIIENADHPYGSKPVLYIISHGHSKMARQVVGEEKYLSLHGNTQDLNLRIRFNRQGQIKADQFKLKSNTDSNFLVISMENKHLLYPEEQSKNVRDFGRSDFSKVVVITETASGLKDFQLQELLNKFPDLEKEHLVLEPYKIG
tara:strand:- start:310 stop:1320 length:1011 start_codon:yes stop_codon:yes gene_type:complete